MKNIGKAVALGIISLSALPVSAMKNRNASVTETMVLNAPLPLVWNAIRTARLGDPEHRRLISTNGSDYVMEETFSKIPIIGCATCRYSEHEIAGNKVEYQMISSDKFVAFEGEWALTPVNAGKQTALTLSSFVDTGLHLPFSANLTRDRTKSSVETRLNGVKGLIEDKLSRLSSTANTAQMRD